MICMYIYLNIYDMITTISKSKTPAPTAPIATSMVWPVFFDSDSTKTLTLMKTKNQ